VQQLTCEKIQLNTVTRPPAENSCRAVDTAVLEQACCLFGPRAEIISSSAEVNIADGDDDPARRMHALLRSHPCTLNQMCTTLGLTPGQADEVLQELLSRKIIEKTGHGSKSFYRASGR
jgi:hypothetical protein